MSVAHFFLPLEKYVIPIFLSMDFGKLINKGKEALAEQKENFDSEEVQKGAEEAYKAFTSTEGSYQKKATAAYTEFSKCQSDKTEKKDDSEGNE
ncbi:hypothetical protein JCM33374_g3843 [Metschnikowia sp. JCM 33374]|nr:hypothetical protein JCM33374_g3843 [Metschnikowia sp. JCM 33374]